MRNVCDSSNTRPTASFAVGVIGSGMVGLQEVREVREERIAGHRRQRPELRHMDPVVRGRLRPVEQGEPAADGAGGSAIIRDDRLEYFHTSAGADGNQAAAVVDVGEVHGGGAEKSPDAFQLGHLRQYVDLVDAITHHRRPGVTAADALVALTAVRAMHVSATLHQPVAFARVAAGDYDDLVVVTG